MNLQAIIFDYDGVLADTERLHLRAMQETLAPLRIGLREDEYFERYLGLDDEGVFRAIGEDRKLGWGEDVLQGLVADKASRFQATLAAVVNRAPNAAGAPPAGPQMPLLFPGAAERLAAWSREVGVAIASGSIRTEIEQVLEAEGLLHVVSAIVAAGETERGKPFPDPYVRALDLLQSRRDLELEPLAAGRCLVIEDSPWGIDAARAAGMKVVAVATSYRADRLAAADLVVEQLQDLDLGRLEKVVGGSPTDRR